MLFTYQFTNKLDLTKFQKQACHYIGQMKELTYHFYTPNFRMTANIATPTDSNSHTCQITLSEIVRDEDGDIANGIIIIPSTDTRFKQFLVIKEIFDATIPSAFGLFNSNSSQLTTDKICDLLTIISKIDKLKIFC